MELISLDAAYQAAHDKAIIVDRSQLGLLKFSGKSRLDLINRMSTQKVINLQAGQGAATVLTTDIGRIIDRLILYAAGETVTCLTGESNAENIAAYLRRFVFFMDDFHIEDLSAGRAIFGVYGRKSGNLLAGLLGGQPDLPLHHWRQVDLAGTAATLHRADPVAGDAYFVMSEREFGPAIWQQLVDAGIQPAGEESFEYLRIESGLPRFGRELTPEYIPLESNLWDDVSFNKGCYTGQEIIARMESRGRLAKKLVRLRAESLLEPGIELKANGKAAGTVTSAAAGPAGALALGYVKTAILSEALPLTAGSAALTLLA